MEKNSKFAATLSRMLRAGSNVKLADDALTADAILKITQNNSTRTIIAYSTSGRAREFQLKTTLTFVVTTPKGKNYLDPTTISTTRDITYDDNEYLSRDNEEAIIQQEMQNDIINQMIRRIERAKPLSH